MSQPWQHQIRLELDDLAARLARKDIKNPVLKPLADVLQHHKADLVCQLDAFTSYIAEVEHTGRQHDPLFGWTKAALANPKKVEKYMKVFTVEVRGEPVYEADVADALERDLQRLVGGNLVVRLTRHDTNPANNPQPPGADRPVSSSTGEAQGS